MAGVLDAVKNNIYENESKRDSLFVLEKFFFFHRCLLFNPHFTQFIAKKRSYAIRSVNNRGFETWILDSGVINGSNVCFSLRLSFGKYDNLISARL